MKQLPPPHVCRNVTRTNDGRSGLSGELTQHNATSYTTTADVSLPLLWLDLSMLLRYAIWMQTGSIYNTEWGAVYSFDTDIVYLIRLTREVVIQLKNKK